MKTIYLQNKNYEWEAYKYNDISEISNVLESCSISIGDRVSIGDEVSIGNGVSIGDEVSISYGVSIGDGVSIGYGVNIGYEVSIGDGVSIGYRASIGYGVKLPTGIYIQGSKYPVTYVGENRVSIGCRTLSINEWEKQGKEIAEKEGFSEKEIKEYEGYIQIIKNFVNINKTK